MIIRRVVTFCPGGGQRGPWSGTGHESDEQCSLVDNAVEYPVFREESLRFAQSVEFLVSTHREAFDLLLAIVPVGNTEIDIVAAETSRETIHTSSSKCLAHGLRQQRRTCLSLAWTRRSGKQQSRP